MATYEEINRNVEVVRVDGEDFRLFGTSHTTAVAQGTDQKDSHTFVYCALNESGTYSYGEIAYDSVSVI